MKVLCDCKRDLDPDEEPRWSGWVEVSEVRGTVIKYRPPSIGEVRRAAGFGSHDRVPGHFWHYRIHPSTLRQS